MIQFDDHIFQMGWNHQVVTDRGIQDWKKNVFWQKSKIKDGDCHERAEGLPRKRWAGNDLGDFCSPFSRLTRYSPLAHLLVTDRGTFKMILKSMKFQTKFVFFWKQMIVSCFFPCQHAPCIIWSYVLLTWDERWLPWWWNVGELERAFAKKMEKKNTEVSIEKKTNQTVHSQRSDLLRQMGGWVAWIESCLWRLENGNLLRIPASPDSEQKTGDLEKLSMLADGCVIRRFLFYGS